MTNQATVYLRLPNWIGDVCMCLPSLQLLLDANLKVVVCARPWAKDLLSAYPVYDFIEIKGSWRQDRKAVLKHKNTHFKSNECFGLLLPDSLSSALVFSFTGIKSCGYIDDLRNFLLKWPIKKPDYQLHAVESWFNLSKTALEKWQINNTQTKPNQSLNLKITSEHNKQALKALELAELKPQEFILIAPTATGIHKGKNKVWPYFNEFTQAAIAKGYKVAMCPPPSEIEQAPC